MSFHIRRSGVLLHPSSLPSNTEGLDKGKLGVLGPSAYHFVDFLEHCRFSIWQVLPLVPTHDDLSPYMGLSVLAGNPKLISFELLANWEWISTNESAESDESLLALAYKNVSAPSHPQYANWQQFKK